MGTNQSIAEIPFRTKEKKITMRVQLEKVAQRGCRASICADIQNTTVGSPEQPLVADPALSWRSGLHSLQRCFPGSATE